jgi:hypothetical protein
MRPVHLLALLPLTLATALVAFAQDPPPKPVPAAPVAPAVASAAAPAAAPPVAKPAASKVVGVTVYLNTALVTREVTVPEAVGPAELVVSPLPAATMGESLFAEGADGVRVLSSRYRTRAIQEDNREEVRKLEAKVKENNKKVETIQADMTALTANTALLGTLETFTAATLGTLTDKGQLNSEKTLELVNFIRDARIKGAKDEVALKQQVAAIQEDTSFTQRRLSEVAGGVSRTERDAVVVLEKTKAGPATIRLNYLVSAVTWRPQYKLRAAAKEADPVTVEYLAALTQQTGEDWANVDIILSTAQPLLNASPPDLKSLEVAVASPAGNPGFGGQTGFGGQGGFGGGGPGGPAGKAGQPNMPPAAASPQQSAGGMPSTTTYLKSLEAESRDNRVQAQNELNKRNTVAGNVYANNAANLDQYRDLLASKDELRQLKAEGVTEGPSVNYHLKTKFTLPSRSDDQVIEIAKLDLAPTFYYQAVPLLTQNVYRMADLKNTTDMVLLAGEATMYLGRDFVGQTKMPLVAIGKPFTLGFGVDPQLQVSRQLLDKTRTTQGGNQVLDFKYQILLNSYKATPVDVRVFDRLPYAEASQTIAVKLVTGDDKLSKDPLYLRDERPKNILRWDVKIDPKQSREKALAIEYEYKMELEKSVNLGSILAR